MWVPWGFLIAPEMNNLFLHTPVGRDTKVYLQREVDAYLSGSYIPAKLYFKAEQARATYQRNSSANRQEISRITGSEINFTFWEVALASVLTILHYFLRSSAYGIILRFSHVISFISHLDKETDDILMTSSRLSRSRSKFSFVNLSLGELFST